MNLCDALVTRKFDDNELIIKQVGVDFLADAAERFTINGLEASLVCGEMDQLSGLCLQGDDADCMYFIEDGEVRIMMKQQVSRWYLYTVNDLR